MDQILKEFGNAVTGIFSSELVQLALRGIGIYIVILWLATAFWAYQDMKSRTSNPILPFLAAALIVAFTPLLFIFAAILYRIIRPHERVGEAHERMLAEEAMLAEVERLDHCLGCGRRIEEGWMICPTCRTRLRRVCPSCGKLVGADWVLCAWCGVDFDRQAGRPAVGTYVAPGARPSRSGGRPGPQPQQQAQQPQPWETAPAPVAAPVVVAAAAYGGSQARPQAQPAPAPEVSGWPGAAQADPTAMATPMASPMASPIATQRPVVADPSPMATPMASPMATPMASPMATPAAPVSRPAPAPAPSPFRSISTDDDDIGALVTEPVETPSPATAPRSTSTRSSSGTKPRTSQGPSATSSSAAPAPATSADPALDDGAAAPAPAPISGRRAAQR